MLRQLDIHSLFRGEVWVGDTNLRFINLYMIFKA